MQKKSVQKVTPSKPVKNSGVTVRDFKAIYYQLNAKPDSEIKIFPEKRIVSTQDIIDLNDKVSEKLKNHEIVGYMASIKIALSDKRILDFSSWEEFLENKWDYSAYVQKIDILWDFNLDLPGYQLPQRHTLKLRIGSEIKPNEMFQLLFSSESDIDLDQTKSPVVCKVDFINPVISTELLNIVTSWYEALPKLDFGDKKVNFFYRHDSEVKGFVRLLFEIAGVLIGFIFLKIFLTIDLYRSSNLIQDIGFALAVLWVSVYIFDFIGEIFSGRILGYSQKLKAYSLFNITKGDRNANDGLKKKNDSLVTKIFTDLIATILANIILFLINLFVRI